MRLYATLPPTKAGSLLFHHVIYFTRTATRDFPRGSVNSRKPLELVAPARSEHHPSSGPNNPRSSAAVETTQSVHARCFDFEFGELACLIKRKIGQLLGYCLLRDRQSISIESLFSRFGRLVVLFVRLLRRGAVACYSARLSSRIAWVGRWTSVD